MRSNLVRRLSAAVAGVALVATLGACSAKPGVAAVVNGREFSEDGVGQATLQLSQMTGSQYTPSDIVSFVFQATVINDLAEQAGIQVDDRQVDDYLVQAESQGLTPLDEPMGTVTRDLWRMQIEQMMLTSDAVDQTQLQEAFSEAVLSADVDVNPRYGTYDVSQGLQSTLLGDVVQGSSGSGSLEDLTPIQ